MSLRRYTWRAMQQRPGRTILTMLSIVIGVTAAVAVGLAVAPDGKTAWGVYRVGSALVKWKQQDRIGEILSRTPGLVFALDVLEVEPAPDESAEVRKVGHAAARSVEAAP